MFYEQKNAREYLDFYISRYTRNTSTQIRATMPMMAARTGHLEGMGSGSMGASLRWASSGRERPEPPGSARLARPEPEISVRGCLKRDLPGGPFFSFEPFLR